MSYLEEARHTKSRPSKVEALPGLPQLPKLPELPKLPLENWQATIFTKQEFFDLVKKETSTTQNGED